MKATRSSAGKGQDKAPAGDEPRLTSENSFLKAVINGVADPIVVVDTDFKIQLCNRAALMLAGQRQERVCAAHPHCYRLIFGFGESCDAAVGNCPLAEVLQTKRPVTAEYERQAADGSVKLYELTSSPLQAEDGTFLGVMEILRDITERKRALELLQKGNVDLERRAAERTVDLEAINAALLKEVEDRRWAEDQLLEAKKQAELVYRVIPSAIFTVDLLQQITSWNNKAEEITGYKREEVLGQRCGAFALQPCTNSCGLFSPGMKKPIMGRECLIRSKDGRTLMVSKNADLLRNTAGEVIGGIESFEDITERKQNEEVIRAERDKFRCMLLALGQGMHILNRNFLIEYQNDVLRQHFGDQIGRKCYEVYRQQNEPCENCRMLEAIETSEIQRTEILMSDDRYYEQFYAPFKDVDGQAKALILLRDITEEKARHAETMRAGQLASIGELAAGVAHEINNPINGIINYAQILWDQGGRGDEDQDILARIIAEGERIAEIVRNLLFFARQQDDKSEMVNLQMVVADAVALIEHQLLNDGITLTVRVPADLPSIKANHRQLQQVFLNLLSNARYALNQRYAGKDSGKTLEISGEVVALEGREFVRLTFTDQGVGILPELIDSIFAPFFSTKKPGEGTGLGLSISHGLIKNFHGFMRVKSEPGRYTSMVVDLPVYSG
ncbi:PAS domain-containing protein [Desulfurivibrio sp. D14AmB]|uniref:PAS domain-containing protein n=1 Tax=Desulfurivibrio sp. D14AmB TaxID=3374370 RepID=UPI00376F25BA